MSAEKSDIKTMIKGAQKIKSLKNGDKVLIAEACSHHCTKEDIGRVKIPSIIKKYSGKKIDFDFCSGQDYPSDFKKYSLIIHCGACTLNRKAMLSRLDIATKAGVAITNYGMAISFCNDVFERVVEIFN